jgi:hypothetical protein
VSSGGYWSVDWYWQRVKAMREAANLSCPDLPDHWEPMERLAYRSGWQDAMKKVKEAGK